MVQLIGGTPHEPTSTLRLEPLSHNRSLFLSVVSRNRLRRDVTCLLPTPINCPLLLPPSASGIIEPVSSQRVSMSCQILLLGSARSCFILSFHCASGLSLLCVLLVALISSAVLLFQSMIRRLSLSSASLRFPTCVISLKSSFLFCSIDISRLRSRGFFGSPRASLYASLSLLK